MNNINLSKAQCITITICAMSLIIFDIVTIQKRLNGHPAMPTIVISFSIYIYIYCFTYGQVNCYSNIFLDKKWITPYLYHNLMKLTDKRFSQDNLQSKLVVNE